MRVLLLHDTGLWRCYGCMTQVYDGVTAAWHRGMTVSLLHDMFRSLIMLHATSLGWSYCCMTQVYGCLIVAWHRFMAFLLLHDKGLWPSYCCMTQVHGLLTAALQGLMAFLLLHNTHGDHTLAWLVHDGFTFAYHTSVLALLVHDPQSFQIVLFGVVKMFLAWLICCMMFLVSQYRFTRVLLMHDQESWWFYCWNVRVYIGFITAWFRVMMVLLLHCTGIYWFYYCMTKSHDGFTTP